MALVTSDFLAGLMTNFRAIFKQSLDEAVAEVQLYKEIATLFQSTSDKECLRLARAATRRCPSGWTRGS